MKTNKIIVKISYAILFLLACITLLSLFNIKANAAPQDNKVYFKNATVEANESGLIIAELVCEGVPSNKVEITYHTEGVTAIQGLDYDGVNNTIRLQMDSDGKASYKISIKSLNTAETREILRVYDLDNTYGRYFKLIIDDVINGVVDQTKSTCKCYLPYDYKAEAIITTNETAIGDNKVAYFKEYSNFQARYHKGVSNLDGGSTWYTFQHGNNVTFTDVTEPWVNTFINTGLASAYGSYMINYIGETKYFSTTNIHILYGGKEFMDNYTRSRNTPGIALYLQIEPCYNLFKDVGYRMNETAMKMIILDKENPYSDHDKLVDVKEREIKGESKHLYWYQKDKTWYSGANSVMDSAFLKIEPYNGVLDTGIAIYNGTDEIDRKANDIWQFLTLVDDKTPEIVSEYVDDSEMNSSGKLKFYIRFNEAVYMAREYESLNVYINNGSQAYIAKYVEGNYSDTLVFELDNPPKTNIKTVTYELPNNNIGDLAYNYDKYKNINNNKLPESITNQRRTFKLLNGAVNLLKPTLTADIESSTQAQNIYNILLSINNNGEKEIIDGSIYYTFDKDQDLLNKEDNVAYNSQELENPEIYDNAYKFTEEENGSLTLTLVKSEKDSIDSGVYYLHVLAKSGYGLTDIKTYGPYTLDGDPPAVNQLPPSINLLKTKEYALRLANKGASGAQLMNLNIVYKYVDNDNKTKEAVLKLYENSSFVIPNIREESDNESTTYYYKSTIDNDLGIQLDPIISEIMNNNSRMTFDVYFVIEDTAGNKSKSNTVKVVYDKRDLFKVDVEYPIITDLIPDGFTKIEDINVSFDAYDISTADINNYIVISISNDDAGGGKTYRDLLVDGTRFTLTVNGETKTADGTDGEAKYRITLTNLTPGFYEIVPRISGESSTGNVDIVSQNISFYLTSNKNDDTKNKMASLGNLVLNNKVFQLQDKRYYYLDQSGSTVLSHAYGATYDKTNDKYEGGSLSPTFSNINEAKKYIKFMEYQDLYLVKITANIASLLNSGQASTTYVKATGETMIAQEGQLWIRYKKNTWQSSATNFSWAFYYYGNGSLEEGININSLPTNLNNAINEIVNRIANEGTTRYLVDEEGINQLTGAPYLASGQIHVDYEEATISKAGSKFLTLPKYDGDKTIYKNKIKVGDVEYPLATNMVLQTTDSTRIFYKYSGEGEWNELMVEDGKRLSQIFTDQASGFYLFREYGKNGICEYSVYYDKTLPNIDVLVGGDPQILNGEILSFSSSSFTINSIIDAADDLAYVAIYSYPNKALKNVLYNSDLETDSYTLTEGNYYLQVGDRSGNIITYTILLSTTTLSVEAYTNDTKTSIVVKVLDRSAEEIYSYEVYLNESLVTTEFQETRIFKDPGIYRITVMDIYGNEVTKVVEFEYKTPEINWYYLNSSESYSKYDPENIVRMAIYDDENSSRVSNVYTATLIRFSFVSSYGDDPIKFEILDLASGDYSYSESNDTVTINKLQGFRLRVWFESNPESDHTYVVRIDNEAPIVSASFIGTSFAYYVETDENNKIIKSASIDVLDFSKYNDGDLISLDTLAYIPGGTLETLFENNALISGGHIVLGFSDPSKIKSYTVTRNGQKVDLALNTNNELIINSLGEYEITVTDMLGNVKKFNFINTNNPITVATIDNNTLSDNIPTYGNTSVVIKSLYPGENRILIDNGEKATYIFKYDGDKVTYGQYICVSESIEDENGEYIESKSAQFREDPNFILDIKNEAVRENTWYQAIVNEDYIISVMIVDKKPIYSIECVEKEIDFEVLYNVGNTIFPSYYVGALSKEVPTLKLLTGDDEVEIKEDSKYIYISDILTIDNNINENIVKIEAGYSASPSKIDIETIYENNEFIKEFKGTEDGFYKIIVTNKFNNVTEYILAKVDSFTSIVNAIYLDGSTREFLTNENIIYSNSMIKLDVYSDTVNFEVNGEVFSGLYDAGITTLELYKQGEYTVKVVSSNGIFENFNFIINSDFEFVYDEDWITGYNENALLHDQGYTNTLLTPIKVEGIEYIEYQYQDNDRIVLYDNISEEKIIDESKLINSIGNDGNGDYIIYFKNIYGDVASKTIHYSNIASLELSRKTVSGKSFEKYDLEKAINNNFYSNYILKFETKSLKYEFSIDGVSVSLDEAKTLEFSNSSGNGLFSYDIIYLDEYGNYIEFKAELYRTDITIDKSQMKEIVVGNNTYTKDDIVITFDDNLHGTVTVNDIDEKEYISGTKFYKDGKYEFIVEDIAGNRNVYVINHKSVNQYELVDSITNQPVIIGGVINNSSVVFRAIDDSKIKSVFKDGRQITDFNSNSFATTGHWEIIIEDSVGNRAYAGFYVINNPLVSFDYKAPFDYEITEVALINSSEQRELLDMGGDSISLVENGNYAIVVTGKESTSSFNFSITINDTPPQATLVGVEDGGVTARNVTLKGLKNGDVVEIYKDGILVSTTDVQLASNSPEITTGGNYKIIITAASGAKVEYNFTRKQIANAATSVFIIITSFVAMAGLGIGLLYHTRLKNDSSK